MIPPTQEEPTGYPNLDDFMVEGGYYSLPDLRRELAAVLTKHQRVCTERDAAVQERDETVAGADYRRKLLAALETRCATAEAKLAAAERDAKRLEWMQRNCCEVVCHDLENDAPHWELRYIDPTWNEDKPPLTSDGGSLREAIDAALTLTDTPTRQTAGGEG